MNTPYYYLTEKNEVAGPLPLHELERLQIDRKLPLETQVTPIGKENWKPLHDVLIAIKKKENIKNNYTKIFHFIKSLILFIYRAFRFHYIKTCILLAIIASGWYFASQWYDEYRFTRALNLMGGRAALPETFLIIAETADLLKDVEKINTSDSTDFYEGIHDIKELAEEGFAPAQTCLAACHLNPGLHDDLMKFFKKDAYMVEKEQKIIERFYKLLTYDGLNIGYEESLIWLEKAADGGCHAAQTTLALNYFAEKQYTKGLKAIRPALNANYTYAKLILAINYLYGVATEQSYPDAIKLLREAADNNNVEACLYLSELCREGIGMEKSNVESYRWLKKAEELMERKGR